MRFPLPALVCDPCSRSVTAPAALALDADEMFKDPTKEERARDIGRQLRCMVCQNQSIFDSNSGLAKDLRVLVRERMEAGDEDGEVLSYISDRYGDYVLLEPRMDAKNAVLVADACCWPCCSEAPWQLRYIYVAGNLPALVPALDLMTMRAKRPNPF